MLLDQSCSESKELQFFCLTELGSSWTAGAFCVTEFGTVSFSEVDGSVLADFEILGILYPASSWDFLEKVLV